MRGKRFLALISGIAFLMLGIFGNAALGGEKTYTLVVSTPYPPPEQSLATTHLVTWEKMVTERTNGKVKFKNYFGGALGKAAEHLSLCSSGSVDIVISYGWYTPSELPLQDYDYAFPFGPSDPFIITKAMRRIYEEIPEIKAELQRQNITRIFQSPGLKEIFLSKTPVKRFEDFKGKKCKVIGKYFGRWIKALGMAPVSAPGTEVYTMLQTGVVDIALDTLDLHHAYKNIEQAPYVIDPELMVTNWISCWINLDSLKRLPEKYQKILLRSGEELEMRAALEINPQWEERIISSWKKNPKVKFIKLSDEDRRKWANACPNTPAEWADEVTKLGLPGWKILRRYMEITSDLGHVWVRDWSKK